MLGFIIGLMVGGTTGVFTMCLCRVAQMPINVWITQIPTNNFVRYGDTILRKNMVSLLVERS